MSSDYRSWEERDADLRRREALDAPKIAAAKARAAEIEREALKASEADAEDRAEKQAAKAKSEAAQLADEQAESRRKVEAKKLDRHAASGVKKFAAICFLVALPLQLRAFWDPDRPWNAVVPVMLEVAAWAAMRLAHAAIVNRRVAWPYLTLTFVFASVAAGINIADGFLHPEIGAIFGLAGGFASLAGPGLWAVHQFGARAKEGKATRAERKLAESQAKQAEAELEATRVQAKALLEAKRVEVEGRQKLEADRRDAHEEKVAADKAAADTAVAAQDEQRKTLYPGAWTQYELILAASPLGSISRDRAWDEARRADAHPDVWSRYQILALNAPANTKSSDLWAEAWVSEKGLPPGHTIEGLASKLAAREYVDQTLAEHLGAAEHLAVEELLADIFGGRGEGGGTPAKGGPRKPNGGPSEGATGLVNIGREGDTASRYKHDTDPLADADLEAARQLHDLAPEKFSTPAVAKLLGRSPNYAKRIRDAVRDAANTPKEEQ
ncbi:hypothetical protein ACFXB3_07300 [Streptomyces sp. NPDC059447]|uniref:hypothetical protein n=1 Tax=Streptomyces sp. NPDC059447 TaxID=3346834 RepID=UPI003686A1C1